MYLARGDEVDSYRPICQGDVFCDVEIPGVGERSEAMVLSHPCAMRAGPRLRAKVTVVPVLEHSSVALEDWRTGQFRVMPLPHLEPDGDRARAAKLEEPMTISSELLELECRSAILSDGGIVLLQQRYIHNHSRAVIPLEHLHAASAAVLDEVELQESWNVALVKPAVDAGGDLTTLLEQEASAFDDLMRSSPEDGPSLRERLKRPAARASVRRAVHAAIAERSA
jgi:hypothetical protein